MLSPTDTHELAYRRVVALFLAALCVLLACLNWFREHRWVTSLGAFFWLWSILFVIAAIRPVELSTIDKSTAEIYAIAMSCVLLGAILGEMIPAGHRRWGSIPRVVSHRRTWIAAVVAILFMAVGVILFRSVIASSASQGYGSLTAIQVRQLASGGTAVFSFRGLPIALAPVAAAVGALTLRVNRLLGGVVIVSAVAATATTPERLSVVTTALTALVVWLLDSQRHARNQFRPTSRSQRRIGTRLVVIVAALGLSFAYFQHEGHSLKKDSLSLGYPILTHHIPASLTVPYLYLEGGISGFAYAHQNQFNPAQSRSATGAPLHGSTIFIVPRVEHVFDKNITPPLTVKEFVFMPAPSNVYGWVGDLWFDWGYSGVVIGALLTGALMAWLTRRARSGRDGDRWLLAAATIILLEGFLEFQWLWLDTILIFGVGWIAIRLMSQREQHEPTVLADHPPSVTGARLAPIVHAVRG